MDDMDQIFMREALKQARRALNSDEVPVGAVIVRKDAVIARAYNQVEMLKDPTAHAEMIALTQATNAVQSKWLQDCCLYVTLEPCCMCAGALVLARIGRVCFGARDPKAGACGSVLDLARHSDLNHHFELRDGVLAEECSGLLSGFFQGKRALGKK
ncbi:MAG TPA: tRNA adenosine(34) deaminase TadA [Candidatus Omnitrophota bacterium]|nr:tRNA adenosine(34) deaminase TadA [Candidatus Omnitrophota bacterium]HSA31808.1 tRNA adenosine(34) deaminase TadA [Candidatus Omnitrophota bacterium]